jgi:hypothetical protein
MYDAANPFHAGHKLGWLEAIASDSTMKGNTLKAAVAISQRAQRDGIARTASQPWIAKRIGITPRAVRNCIGRLCRAGYLERLSTGGHTKDGRVRSAEWGLVIPPQRVSSSGKTNPGVLARNPVSGNVDSKSPEAPFQKTGSTVPPIPSSSPKNLPTASGPDQTDVVPISKPDCPWPAIKERLARSATFGPHKVAMWLDPLTVKSISDGILTLVSSSKFIAREVRMNFERHIVEAWREVSPHARLVKVDYLSAQPRSQQGDDDVDF